MRKLNHQRDGRLGGARRLGNLGEQIMFKSERALRIIDLLDLSARR